MWKLEFQNPTFQRGRNYTVRLGSKWWDRLNYGDIVSIGDNRQAFICELIIGRVEDIPLKVLADEHDPTCRSVFGLMAFLRRVYEAELGKLDSLAFMKTGVTCLGFYVLD